MTSTALTSSTSLSNRSSISKFNLTYDLLSSAKDILLEQLELARDHLLEQDTQIILAENVSLEDFLKVYSDYIEDEQDLPVKIRLVDKKVIAYEVTLTPGSRLCHIICLHESIS